MGGVTEPVTVPVSTSATSGMSSSTFSGDAVVAAPGGELYVEDGYVADDYFAVE